MDQSFYDAVPHGTLTPEEARVVPEAVTYWIRQIEKAARFVEPGRSICDYQPWQNALRRVRQEPIPPETTARLQWGNRQSSDLMQFGFDVSRGLRREARADFIDFALVFLEADVMLFQSGYLKRDLILGLRRADLSAAQVDRIDAVLKCAVLQGTGPEEFRAFARLSAHLVVSGVLEGWEECLEEAAKGAILDCDALGPEHFVKMIKLAEQQGVPARQILGGMAGQPAVLGVAWPELDRFVPAGPLTNTPQQRAMRNAARMCAVIRRKRVSEA